MLNGRVREVSGETLRQGVLGEHGSCTLYSRAKAGWVGGPDTVTRYFLDQLELRQIPWSPFLMRLFSPAQKKNDSEWFPFL